mmetsp:Transcript_5442/g.20833  ORF Transcript_5442/g.20833 Transcript_5442/m.20833 type:complete len:566 (-) Transcript_5442:6566-8263(-)
MSSWGGWFVMASSVAGVSAAAAAYRLADLDFDVGGRHVLRGHRTRTLGLEARRLGQRAGPLVGNRAGRVLEPARVLVVARFLVLADLDHGEHAPHLDRAEGAVAGHHRRRVVGQRHRHLGHVGHAALGHHHVVRYQLRDLLDDLTMVHADHRRHVVPHRVHRVMTLMAVEGPVAFLVGQELDLAHLTHGHVGGHLVPARPLGCRSAIRPRHEEFVAVQVDRVVGHRQVADADAHLVVLAHVQGIDPRKHSAVPRPEVEVQHRHDLGRVGTRLDVVGVEQEDEVAVDFFDQRVLGLGVRHPEAHHSHRHLRHLVGVRVVHESARPPGHELVDKGLPGLDGHLREAHHTVHAVRKALAMPVDGGALGKLVGHKDADAIAFDNLDGRAGRLAVVAPQVCLEARRHLAHHGLCHQVELLDAVVHAPGEGPAVERDHRVVGTAGIGHQRRHGVGFVLQDRLRKCGHGHAAHAGRGHGHAGTGATDQEVASIGCHGGVLGSVTDQCAAAPERLGAASVMRLMSAPGVPRSSACRPASASQKSRWASMACDTLVICSRASARSSNTPMSMPL